MQEQGTKEAVCGCLIIYCFGLFGVRRAGLDQQWNARRFERNNTGKVRSPLDKERGPRNEGSGLEGTLLCAVDSLNNEHFLQMRLAQAPFPGLHFISGPICLQLRYYYQSNVDVI